MNHLWQQLRLIPKFTLVFWQVHSAERWSAIIWILNGFITPTVLTGVWLVIRSQQTLPLNNDQIITYFILTIIMTRLTQSWAGMTLGQKIKDGDLANHVVMPLQYWVPQMSRDLSLKALRLVSLVPFFLVFTLFFGQHLELELGLSNLILFSISTFIGFLISFLMENIMGLLAFWLEHVDGAHTIYWSLTTLFGGLLIPFSLMSPLLRKTSELLPFQYLMSFPISMLMPMSSSQALTWGLLKMCFWFVTLFLLWRVLYKQGIKNFSAVGA